MSKKRINQIITIANTILLILIGSIEAYIYDIGNMILEEEYLLMIIFVIYTSVNLLNGIINYKDKKICFWYITLMACLLQLGVNYLEDDFILIQMTLCIGYIIIFSIKNIITLIRNQKKDGKIILYIFSLIYGMLHLLNIEEENLHMFLFIDSIWCVVMQYIYLHTQNKQERIDNKVKLIFSIIESIIIVITSIAILVSIMCFLISWIKSKNYQAILKKNLDMIALDESYEQEDEIYIPVCKNNQWGYINEKGEEVISCKYDDVTEFFSFRVNGETEKERYSIPVEVAMVRVGEEYKAIAKDETILASCKNNVLPWKKKETNLYIGIRDLDSGNRNIRLEEKRAYATEEKAISIKEEKVGTGYNLTVSKNGNIISTVENVEYLPKNLYSNGGIPFFNIKEKIQGWIDTDGAKYFIKGDYRILDVKDENVFIKKKDEDVIYIYNQEGVKATIKEVRAMKQGYIITGGASTVFMDNQLNKISGFYDSIDETYVNQNVLIVEKGNQYAIMDLTGQILTNKEYDYIKGYANDNHNFILYQYYLRDKLIEERTSDIITEKYEKYLKNEEKIIRRK